MFSFPGFNREHAKAKRCWMKAIESDCKYSSDFFEAIRFDMVEYNPFCANNRHPGATGNDQCLGVRDIKNPFNRKNDFGATAGVKINALLALLPPLVSVFFSFLKFKSSMNQINTIARSDFYEFTRGLPLSLIRNHNQDTAKLLSDWLRKFTSPY